MNATHTPIPADGLAMLADPDTQRQAARLAQDAFAGIFRLGFSGDDAGRRAGFVELEGRLRAWWEAGADDGARALRLALLVAGLDQWGVAYSRAFELPAIPGLSALVGALRTGLEAEAEARFERAFAALDAVESDAIDYKVELRRAIHLALWHAMIASEERVEAMRILQQLGGLMLGLTTLMPVHGWRLVADALAHIQIRCLADGLAVEGLAQETTEGLFASLSQALPKETRDRVFAHAAQATLAWQQAKRPH